MPSSVTAGSSSAAPAQFLRRRRWPSPWVHRLGTPEFTVIRFGRASQFRGFPGSLLLRPVELLAPGGSDRAPPSRRGLLLPSFRRVGHPSRRRV